MDGFASVQVIRGEEPAEFWQATTPGPSPGTPRWASEQNTPLRLWLSTLRGTAGTVPSVREEGPIPDERTRFSSQREDDVDHQA